MNMNMNIMKGVGVASSSSFSFCTTPAICTTCYSKPQKQRFLQVRSQSLRDDQEGSSSSMVDANLSVLRARIEQVVKNEKLEYIEPQMKKVGWKYDSVTAEYETRDKNGYAAIMTETMEVVGLVTGSFGLVFLVGSLLVFLVSLLVHLCL